MFENGGLRNICGPIKKEVTGEWKRLHNEELHNSYSSQNIIRVTKSRRKRWAVHEARVGERRNSYRGMMGNPQDRARRKT